MKSEQLQKLANKQAKEALAKGDIDKETVAQIFSNLEAVFRPEIDKLIYKRYGTVGPTEFALATGMVNVMSYLQTFAVETGSIKNPCTKVEE